VSLVIDVQEVVSPQSCNSLTPFLELGTFGVEKKLLQRYVPYGWGFFPAFSLSFYQGFTQPAQGLVLSVGFATCALLGGG